MKSLAQLVSGSEKKKKIVLLLTYIINIVVIQFFMMMITGTSNVTNESLSPNDYEQMYAILMSIIGVSVISIIFFQWIIVTLFRSLYASRQHFNVNMRLIGFGRERLFSIYVREYLSMQLLAIPLGTAVGWLFYRWMAATWDLQSKTVNSVSMISAPVIHLVAAFTAIAVTFVGLTKLSPIDELRGSEAQEKRLQWTIYRKVKTVIGIAALLFILVYRLASENGFVEIILFFAALLLYDAFFYLFNRLVSFLAARLHFGPLAISQHITAGNFRRTRSLCFMLLFSVVFTVGIQATFATVRDAGIRVVEENVHYQAQIQYDAPVPDADIPESENAYTAIKLIAEKRGSNTIRLQGISREFLERYETVHLEDGMSAISEEELLSHADDVDWNGILFPSGYIGQDDIHQPYSVELNGRMVEFEILGGYYINSFGEMRCLVSNAYLEKHAGLTGQSTIAFYLDKIPDGTPDGAALLTKDGLIQRSHDKAIQSTEIVELTCIIILICVLVMFLNYVNITISSYKIDIVKLRGFGMSSRGVLLTFILHFCNIVISSLSIALPLAVLLAQICFGAILGKYFMPNGVVFPYGQYLGILAIIICIPAALFGALTKNTIKRDYSAILRDRLYD